MSSDQQAKNDIIPGGLADDKSCQDIANYHKMPFADIKDQLDKGIEVELEHTNDKTIAKEIAKDHIYEDPKYYDKLKTIEKSEGGKAGNDAQIEAAIDSILKK